MNDRTMQRGPAATWPWPPEVPAPVTPDQPAAPGRRQPAPQPILPSWEEPAPLPGNREIVDRLLDERVILLTGRLDDVQAERTAQRILLLGRRDPDRPIELHLSCRSSDLAASLAVAAAIDLAGAPTHATVTGTLSGPAVVVLCASVQRTAHRHATFALAIPSDSGAESSGTDITTRAEEHARMVAHVVERVAAATGHPVEEVAEDLRTGRVLSAREAKEYGLVEDVQ